ncbi:MAG: 2-oxo acid dehydrogenase subunit E2 [Planctomycetota bacterium]|jgi:pyruvate dehydrogenase E2 component (dihydrolipoamide acetyltransferase)|nr:2-oxo acid dehydrogenase subunit E2 [Planctomycetota bacterium]
MAVSVQMPKQGNTVEECLLVEWKVREGDSVHQGDVLCSIETDKASFDVPSTADGVVLKLLAKAGDLVPVLTDIVILGEAGESAGAAAPAPAKKEEKDSAPAAAPAAKEAPVPAPAAAPAASAPASGGAGGFKAVSPRARSLAGKMGVDAAAIAGTGIDGRVTSLDVKAAVDSGAAVKLSPLAKEAAASTGQTAGIGTGVGGLGLLGDLGKGAPARRAAMPVQEKAPVAVPYKGIRKLIGDRMLQSLAEHAQLTHNTSADASGLMALRKIYKDNAEAAGLPKISINDLICWVVVQTLQEFPDVNAVFDKKAGVITQHSGVNLGFAVDTPRGLMVPVVRDAHRMGLAELSRTMVDYAGQCRKGSINPDFLAGGTFTVSNLGAFGIESFTPIINGDQVAILGVCAIRDAAAKGPDGKVVLQPRLYLSLTYDHQAADGAPASRFLQAVAKGIENIQTTVALYGAF